MKITKIEDSETCVLAIDKVRVYFKKYKREHNVIFLLDEDENIVASIFSNIEKFYDALNESNLYIEELEDFQENEIDENLNYPTEDISEELESKKEIDDIQIAKEIRDFSNIQRNFKAKIKARIKENNGLPWIKDFSKNYYWEDVLKNITGNTKQWEITPVLQKYKIKFNTREEELYINMEPTQGHYSECEEFFRTVDGETFKLRWDYHHEEILEISRP